MNRLCWLFVMICVPMFGETTKLTLRSAQEDTLRRSEELSIAQIQTLIATEKFQQIRGINLPKLAVEANYNWRDTHLGFERKNPAYGRPVQGPPGVPPPPKMIRTIAANKEVRTARLGLRVPVYDFGRVAYAESAQRAIIESTVHERDRVRQDLLFAVATNFYRALEGAKIEAVVNESIAILKRQHLAAQDLYAAGLVTHNDVLVIEVQLAEREQERIAVQYDIESVLATLRRLTGRTIDGVVGLEDVQGEIQWSESLDTLQRQSDLHHPVLKKIQADKAVASSDVLATKAENSPDVCASFDVNCSSDTYLLRRDWLHAGIGISIPIFDGGIVDSKVAQKRKVVEEIDLKYSKAIEDIHLEVAKAYLRVDQAFLQIPVAQQSIALATDNLAISQDLFNEGLVTSDDVMNDEGRLAQARSNYVQAVYDFYLARSALEYASGIIVPSAVS